MNQQTQYLNIESFQPLLSPRKLRSELPMSRDANRTVVEARDVIQRILQGDDQRVIAEAGPCSILDERSAIDYARRLVRVAKLVSPTTFVVMRVYFEKPRTTVGWKGLINDPHLNNTFDMETGLRLARSILDGINALGLPAGSEMLDPITPPYISGYVACASLGARTTESQTHRQMASGLSMPVGFKNGTDGNIQVAIDAMLSARHEHSFLGMDDQGRTCIISTKGNKFGHLILRGGHTGPNYQPEAIRDAVKRLERAGVCPNLMVDCSHANSDKDFRNQAKVWKDVIGQRCAGNTNIVALMLESNIKEGSQKLNGGKLTYGRSVTDGCIGWRETEELLLWAHEQLSAC